WLFYTVAVVCLLRKGKPFMAGVAMAYAALLRLFPGLLLLGPLLAGFEYARVRWWPARPLDRGEVPRPSRALRALGITAVLCALALAALGAKGYAQEMKELDEDRGA